MIFRKICTTLSQKALKPLSSQFLRSFTVSNRLNYDAEEKTSVTILNFEPELGIMVDTYSQEGFRLNNGSYVIGPVAIFPHTILNWNVSSDEEINEASLTLFTILEPKLDLLVIGYGQTGLKRPNIDKEILAIKKRRNFNIELLPTPNAIATYNFLVADKRFVAAALIPPLVIPRTDNDLALSMARKKAIYSD